MTTPVWRKSSLSSSNANCVEVAWLPQPLTAVRDSKNTAGPALTFPTTAWRTFLHTTA